MIGHSNPTHTDVPIAELCVVGMISEGLGLYDIMSSVSTDSTRASKAHKGDTVQFSYAIFDTEAEAHIIDPLDIVMHQDTSTHAHFHHDFGAANQGKWLVIYFRWFNTKHPELAGRWSAMRILAIG